MRISKWGVVLAVMFGLILTGSRAWSKSTGKAGSGDRSVIAEQAETIEQLKKDVAQLKDDQTKAKEKSGSTGYDKGFFIKSGDDKYSFKLRFYSQIYYEYDNVEDAVDVNSFGIRRARLMLSGSVFTPNLTYMIMPEMVTQYVSSTTAYTVVDSAGDTETFNVVDTNDRNFRLLYLWMQYRVCDEFQIRLGEFVPPTEYFFRATNVLLFNDLPIIAMREPFTPGFQTGLDLLGTIAKKLDYEVFAVNGSGFDRLNTNKHFRIGAMLTYNILGKPSLGVSDIDYSTTPQLAVTASGAWERYDAAQGAPANITAGDNVIRGQGNVVFRYKGFAFVPEFIMLYDNNNHTHHYGMGAQTSYFIIPKRFEIAAQANYLRFDGPANDQYEFSGGLNYYFFGQPVKLQADYSRLIYKAPGDDQGINRIRVGAQIGFF